MFRPRRARARYSCTSDAAKHIGDAACRWATPVLEALDHPLEEGHGPAHGQPAESEPCGIGRVREIRVLSSPLYRCGPRQALSARWVLIALVSVLLAGAVWPRSALARSETASPAAEAAAATASRPAWAHELAGRTPDPAVRFGHLPNGLRYALKRNETPKDGVAMRLYIGSGAMAEREEEQGLAHFLEHMAFRGSRNLSDGELVRRTERLGLRLGPDTNAFTAHDQTVYQFNFPRADAEALDTGLTLFREIGEHLTLDAKKVELEKGVILSEERARDSVAFRATRAELNNLLAGTRFAQRWPIGQVSTIQAATPERLRRYYEAHYRPDNALIVVVGPIDVDAVERQVRERFADWKPAAAAEAIDFGRAQPAQPAVEFVADGAAERLTLSWVQPADLRLPTLAVERERLLAHLAVAVLNQRLSDRALQPGSPFVGANAALQFSVNRLAQVAQLGVSAPSAQWSTAMAAAVDELRRLQQDGVQPDDLQRLLPPIRSHFQALAAQASTRQSAQLADALVRTVHLGAAYTSPGQDVVLAVPMLDALRAEDLTAALRKAFAGQGPVVFRSAKADPVGTETLAQQLAQALSRPLAAAQARTEVSWPYTDFGAPSAVLERRQDAELGTTTVRFANGTRLVVKPTAQEKDRIQVHARFGPGRSGVPTERAHALWVLDSFALGGTGKLSLAEFQQWLLNIALQMNVNAHTLVGTTRPADLQAQLQVLAAFARDPGFRPELGEKVAAAGPMVGGQIEAQASSVFSRSFSRVISGGDPRMSAIPSAADIAATRAEDFPALLRAPLAGAPDVIIVGDTDVDAAIAAVQASFGAGPERPRAERLPMKVTLPAAGSVQSDTHGGRADQAVLGQVWALPDGRTEPALRAVAQVAAAVLRARLVETVREQLGITYAPQAFAAMSLDLPGQGYFAAQIETPPDKFDTFRQLLQRQLRTLADQPVGADELQRARQPIVEARRKAPENNGFWLGWLARIAAEPAMKAEMLGEPAALDAVSAEQVQAFIRERLAGRAAIEVVARAK